MNDDIIFLITNVRSNEKTDVIIFDYQWIDTNVRWNEKTDVIIVCFPILGWNEKEWRLNCLFPNIRWNEKTDDIIFWLPMLDEMKRMTS